MRERVNVKSPVREYRPPGSVRGAPGNRCPYLDNSELKTSVQRSTFDVRRSAFGVRRSGECAPTFALQPGDGIGGIAGTEQKHAPGLGAGLGSDVVLKTRPFVLYKNP